MTTQDILTDLAGILRNFQGREYSDTIDRDTRFFNDLGFASIEAVLLGETLEKHYGTRLPFHQLLADLGQRQADDFTVGELADFLARHLPYTREG